MIIANDADYSFTLGEHCIQIVDYKLNMSAPSIAAITVKSGVYSILQDIVNHSSKLAGKVEIKKAAYPLLETMEDPHMRVCIGIVMGCDVLPWGIPGWTPKAIAKKIKEMKDTNQQDITVEALLRAFSDSKKCRLSFEELVVF